MKATNEQRAAAEDLIKKQIRPTVVVKAVLALEPEVGEAKVNNLVKNIRKRLKVYKRQQFFNPAKVKADKAAEKERKKPKKNKRVDKIKKFRKSQDLKAEDLY